MSNATVQMRSMRERVQAADRARRWREENEHRPDTRRVDRVIVEALVEYLRERPPGADDLVRRLVEDATAGLDFQGYLEDASRREVAKRLRYLTVGAGVSTGSVRAARERREIRQSACSA